MKRLQKTAIAWSLSLLMATIFSVQPVNAGLTLLPEAEAGVDCETMLNNFESIGGFSSESKNEETGTTTTQVMGGTEAQLLGCAIKTGRISLAMIPYFVKYITNFLLALVGLICVLFIVIGGYFYIYGGLTEQKEKGKKTIMHALMGLGLAVLSWAIVNIIMAAVTS